MIIKLDLEKPLDRIEWSFVYQTLHHFKFPPNITKLIMFCSTTSQKSILVNGQKTNYFCPNKGIRQGDPMSPCIFILCMEMLSRYINHLVDTHLWDPIKVTPKGPSLSYLFFADDLTLMGKVTRKIAPLS